MQPLAQRGAISHRARFLVELGLGLAGDRFRPDDLARLGLAFGALPDDILRAQQRARRQRRRRDEDLVSRRFLCASPGHLGQRAEDHDHRDGERDQKQDGQDRLGAHRSSP